MLIYPTITLGDDESAAPISSRGANGDVPAASAGELAAQMAVQGFAWVHIIDRDARDRAGAVNIQTITAILDYLDLPLQLDAGTADEDTVDDLLGHGVSRLVLSPALTSDPGRVERMAARHPGQLVAVMAIDAGDTADQLSALQDMPLAGVLVREATSAYSARAGDLSQHAKREGLHCIYDGTFPDFQAFCRMLADEEHGFDCVLTGALYNATDFDAYTALRMVAYKEALSR